MTAWTVASSCTASEHTIGFWAFIVVALEASVPRTFVTVRHDYNSSQVPEMKVYQTFVS